MNIALIIEKFGATGGAERAVGNVAAGLHGRGHEVHVYATSFDGRAQMTCEPHVVTATGLNRHVAFAKAVKEALGKHDVVYSFARTVSQDVIRLGGGIHAEYLARMAPARSAVGRVFSVINPKEKAILALEREGLERTPKIVAVSERVKREAIEHYGIDARKIVALHNGVDLEDFHPRHRAGRKAWLAGAGVPDDGLIVLFAGSGFRRKGLATAIDALPLVPSARLVVCGKDEPAKYKARAKKLHVQDRVHFLGVRKDIASAYGASDALVLPALYDPFPNVCLEAMACGTPVVVSDVCGPSEIIDDGEDSFIEHESDGIASALTILTERRERERMSAAARATAEKHPIGDYVDRTIDLLTSTA